MKKKPDQINYKRNQKICCVGNKLYYKDYYTFVDEDKVNVKPKINIRQVDEPYTFSNR